jgi:ribosome-associated translation inhibitor RaiA
MDIEIRAPNLTVSDYIRQRVERGLEKVGNRAGGATTGLARLSEDGAVRRVELEVHASSRREPIVGLGRGKHWGPAVTAALQALQRQVGHLKGSRKAHVRREAATRRVVGA